MKLKNVDVQCIHCGEIFKSTHGFGSIESFDTSVFAGINLMQCPSCDQQMNYNKKHMRVTLEDGSIHHQGIHFK